MDKIQAILVILVLSGCVPTEDEVKEIGADRVQHMFDKCAEDKTITECRVLVEFKRATEQRGD